MKFIFWNIFIIICPVSLLVTKNSKVSNAIPNLVNFEQNARKSRFSFFREFIEPLPGVLNDIFPSTSDQDPIVDTQNGLIQGTIKESRDGRKFVLFQKIPYATKPIKNLRFEPPRKLEGRWKGVRSAKKHALPCFHMDVFFSGRFMGQEDCLYASVYTTSLDGPLPVMVYFHGGGFTSGSGDFYQGNYFMDENVVLVMFNYRLSGLGFLNTEDGIIEGNQGLKDQNLLLRWVQDNIRFFGGDETRVTLFGESAGAVSVQYHALSPQSQGLFHKLIALSGSVLSPWAFNSHPSASAKRLAKAAGCPTFDTRSMVSCLKTVPVQSFKAEYMQMMKTVANPAEYFAPSLETTLGDDTFLSRTPREILKSGNYSKVPLMMGLSSMEGLLFTSRMLVDPYAMANMDKKFESWIPRYLYYEPDKNRHWTETLKSHYFHNHSIDLSQLQDFLNLTHLLSDGCFVHPSLEFAKLYAQHSPVYLYYNTYQGRFSTFDILRNVPLVNFNRGRRQNRGLRNIPEIAVAKQLFSDLLRYRLTNEKPSNFGPSHGDIVLLLFNLRNVPGIGRQSMDYLMSKTLIKSLVDFASAESNDTIAYNGIPWPTIKPQEDLQYMKIELPGKVVKDPFKSRMELWDKYFKK